MNVPATTHDPAPRSFTGAVPVTHHRTVTIDGVAKSGTCDGTFSPAK